MQVHGSCCAWDGLAVLLRGEPGSGKSDLALRLVDSGFVLVADDRVELALEGGRLVAAAPAALAGLIEVRGIGILEVRTRARAPLALLADLSPAGEAERLPEPSSERLLGIEIPRVRLAPQSPSAVARLRVALDVLAGRAASRCGALGDRPADAA
ncbi:MAG: HPr kinase/phosphatase C-terminal domain-containing protein [Acetobacteraceae bacterium]